MKLSEKRCVPCESGTPPLDGATTKLLLAEVPGWALDADTKNPPRIVKRYEFADFLGAMAFVGRMAALAEA